MNLVSFLQKVRSEFKRITVPVKQKFLPAAKHFLAQNRLLKKMGILNWIKSHKNRRKDVITISLNRSLYTYYLKGSGIEIGALHAPLEILHNNATVKYVDYKSTDELKKHYPNLGHIVKVDIISSAEILEGIEDDSLDFIIANHVIEHLVNPIKTLGKWHNKLRKGGILYLAFPDVLFCPDKVRPITPLSHLIKDYLTDSQETSDEHLLGFVYAWNPNYFKDPVALRTSSAIIAPKPIITPLIINR